MRWFGKLCLILVCLCMLCGVFFVGYIVWYKYDTNAYVDDLSLKMMAANASAEGMEATYDGVTVLVGTLNYNTIEYYLTRNPVPTFSKGNTDEEPIDLIFGGGTEHIFVYPTDDPNEAIVYSNVNGKAKRHRVTQTNVFTSLAGVVDESGFREPNTVLSPAS